MQIDEVDGAASAVAQEPTEVRQGGGGGAVRDGRGAELHRPRERLHERLVAGDGLVDGHARAVAAVACVRLVEGEDRVGPVVRDAVVDVGCPSGGRAGAVVEEQGDENQRRVSGAGVVGGVGCLRVVVGPGYETVLALQGVEFC